MTIQNAWKTLEMEPTTNESAVKAQYRHLLPLHNPEDDPEGFRNLREAYEAAISAIQSGNPEGTESETPPDKEKDEIDLWVDQIAELYKYMDLRSDTAVWKDKLEDPLCIALDTTYEVRERLLVFLMSHYYLPQEVWILLDQVFRLHAEKEDLLERFPEDFIDYVLRQTESESFGPYQYFSYRGQDESEAQYDEYMKRIFTISNEIETICEELDSARITPNTDEGSIFKTAFRTRFDILSDMPEAMERLADLSEQLLALHELDIYHPYEELFRLQIAVLLKQDELESPAGTESVTDVAKRLSGKYRDGYSLRRCADVLSQSGLWEDAFSLLQSALELDQEHVMVHFELSRYYMHQGDLIQADEELKKIIGPFRTTDLFRIHFLQLKQALNALYLQRLEKDPSDNDAFINYCWTLYDNDLYQESIDKLKERDLTDDPVFGFDYVNMMGLDYACMQCYEEAYPYLKKWQKALEELEDDGSEKYRIRKRNLYYQLYTIANCRYHMAISRKDDTLYAESEQLLRRVIDESDDVQTWHSCYYLLGQLYLRMQRYDDCLFLAQQELDKDPDALASLLLRFEANYYLGNDQQVIDDYHQITNAYPGFVRAYVLAMRVFTNYNQLEDTQTVLEKAKEVGVEDPSFTYEELRYMRRSQDPKFPLSDIKDKCHELISKLENTKEDIYSEYPDTPGIDDVWYLLALTYYDQEKYDEALMIIQERMDAGVSTRKYLLLRGDILRKTDRYEEAIESYRKLDPDNSDDSSLHYFLGLCYKALGEKNLAEASFLKSHELDPEDDFVIYELATFYKKRFEAYSGKLDLDRSLAYFNKLYAINPSAYVLSERSRIHCYRCDYEACIADLEEAFEKDPNGEDDDFVCYRLGDMYYLNKQTDKAQAQFCRAIELFAPDQSAPIWELADLYGSKGDWDSAVAIMQKYEYAHTTDHDYYDKMLDFMSGAGMLKECLELCDKMLNSKLFEPKDYWYKRLEISACLTPERFFTDLDAIIPELCRELDIVDPVLYPVRYGAEMAKGMSDDRKNALAKYCYTIGAYYLTAMDYKTAATYLEFALAIKKLTQSVDTSTLADLAEAYFLMGDLKKSADYAKQWTENWVNSWQKPDSIQGDIGYDKISAEYILSARKFDAPIFYYSLSASALFSGDTEGCLEYLSHISECTLCLKCRCQECADEFWLRGIITLAEGDAEGAANYFKQTIRIKPYSATALRYYYLTRKGN